jgi:hypothetical protein
MVGRGGGRAEWLPVGEAARGRIETQPCRRSDLLNFAHRFGIVIVILGGTILVLGVPQLVWSFVVEASFQFPRGTHASRGPSDGMLC